MNTLPSPTRPTPADRRAQPEADLVVGRFRLITPLGSGGHGTVWIARDERLRRNVALKRIPRAHGADLADRRRIGREALAAARLSHPAIVSFYEALSDDRAYYLVTELVDGTSLADLYDRSAVTDCALMRIGMALADALEHAHARGVVHRDVKPANVIVPSDPRATGAPAKLADFGIASIADEQPLTHSGDVIGTLAYMAPEQADGESATAASDLYSLALTLYEGFAGANPLRAGNPAATVRRMGSAIPSLQRVRRDLPLRVCVAIDRALAADPERRGSVAELRADLASGMRGARHRRRGLGVATAAQASALSPPAQRLVAGATAALMCVVALATVLGPHGPTTEACVAAAAFGAVALAPRSGWLLLALTAVVWIAITGQPGTATVVALALAPVPILLAGEPWLWSIPVFGPALGALGVAAAFPGVAARAAANSPLRRCALAAAGYWWVALTEELAGRRLLFGVAAGARARVSWQGSVAGAIEHALVPLCTLDRVAPALLWALAALMLPWLVRAASRALRITAAMSWAGALIVASIVLAQQIGALAPPLPLAAGVTAAVVATTFGSRRLRAPASATVA